MSDKDKPASGRAGLLYVRGPGTSDADWSNRWVAPVSRRRRLPDAHILVQAVPTPAVVHKGGIVQGANAAGARLFGFASSDAMLGFNLFAALSSEELKAFTAHRLAEYAKCEPGANTSWAHFDLRRVDGRLVSVAFTCAQTRYEEEEAVLSFFVDRSQDVALDGALRFSPDVAIISTVASGRVTWCNPASEALSGYTLSEMQGRRPGEVLQFEGTDPAEVARVRRHLRAGSSVVAELLNRHRNGQTYWVRLQLLPSRSPDGRLLGFVGIQTDVTQDMKRRLAQRQAQDSKLATFSHEVRAPLNAVINLLDLIKGAKDWTELQRLADHAIEASASMRSLVNSVLDDSRRDHEQAHQAPSLCRIEDVVSQLSVLASGYPRSPRVRLEVLGPRNMPPVLTRSDLLLRVLLNLTSNALKFTHAGVVTVRVEHDMATSTPQHLMIRASVTDTGIGIEEDDLQRVLQPYETVKRDAGDAVESTGLGLALTSQMLTALGSTLRIHSTPGIGSCFSFELMLPVAALPQVPVEPSTAAKRLDGLTLMLVNDDPLNLMVTEAQLKRYGAEVLAHGDPLQAVAALFALGPGAVDAVLTDINMPDLGGVELTRQVLAQPGFERQLVIGLSGETDPVVLDSAREAGMAQHIPTPFDAQHLVSVLNELVTKVRRATP